MNPVAELRAAVEEAAGALRGRRGPAGRPPTLERPSKAGVRRLLDQRGDAAGAGAGRAAARDRRAARRGALADQLGGRLERVEVAGPGLPQPLPRRRLVPRRARRTCSRRARTSGAGARAPASASWSSSSAPTRPARSPRPAGATPPTATRWRGSSSSPATRSSASTTSTTTGPRSRGSASRSSARARGEEVPEDGYQGDYVARAGGGDPRRRDADVDELARRGVELIIARIRATLERFRVDFDSWFSEALAARGRPRRRRAGLRRAAQAAGTVYRSEGALWLRTTDFGDDKDRVLERSTGEHTYFAVGHRLPRGQARARLRPPDQRAGAPTTTATSRRMKAAFEALGGDPDALELLIMQFVHLVERGERASMSKRRGEFVTLDELIAEIGVDAARWFLLQRSHDTTGRPRPRPRARAVQREPRLLRAVRARADRLDPREGGGGAGRGRRSMHSRSPAPSCTPPSAP